MVLFQAELQNMAQEIPSASPASWERARARSGVRRAQGPVPKATQSITARAGREHPVPAP